MQSLRDIYAHEALARIARGRHRRTRAPGDEGPRRAGLHPVADRSGHLLIRPGTRLLAFGGKRARLMRTPYRGLPPFFRT